MPLPSLPRGWWLFQSPLMGVGEGRGAGLIPVRLSQTLVLWGSLRNTHCSSLCIQTVIQFTCTETHLEEHILHSSFAWDISSVALVFSYKSAPRPNPWLMFWNSAPRLQQRELSFVRQSCVITKNEQCSKLCYQDRHLTSSLIKQYFQPEYFSSNNLKNHLVSFFLLFPDQLNHPVKSFRASICPSGWAMRKMQSLGRLCSTP